MLVITSQSKALNEGIHFFGASVLALVPLASALVPKNYQVVKVGQCKADSWMTDWDTA
jgi:hypothetical protein